MSHKIRVFYGDGKSAITDATVDTSIVVFKVLDVDKKEVDRLEIDGNDLTADNQQRAYLYGINKLLTDRTSDQKDKVLKLEEMSATFDMLCTGEWSKERVVGTMEASATVEALATLQKMSIPDTQAALGQYDKDTRKGILANPEVVKLAAEISEKRKTRTLPKLDEYIPAS